MMRHDKIARHPRTFKTLTGLSAEGCKQLLPAFERAWKAVVDRRDAGRVRRWTASCPATAWRSATSRVRAGRRGSHAGLYRICAQ